MRIDLIIKNSWSIKFLYEMMNLKFLFILISSVILFLIKWLFLIENYAFDKDLYLIVQPYDRFRDFEFRLKKDKLQEFIKFILNKNS